MNEIMGTHIDGLISLDQYWLDHCHTTSPTLTKEFFLVGREAVTDPLIKWLKNADGYRMIKADSRLEAIFFAISAVLSLPDNGKNSLLGCV